MKRTALALLLSAAAPVALGHAAAAQPVEPAQETASTATAQPSAPAQPAGDAPLPATASEQADTGATPTSGQPDQVRREGVTVYRPDFFAAARPYTALDMIARIPGFQLNSGSSARGFAGTAGNVLIDGQRPASKSDTVDSVISRIPATQVERIEIIRGGAPGIDMQGQSVVANIIVRAGDTSQQVVTVGDQIFLQGGQNIPSLSYQVTRTAGPRTFEFSASRGVSLDDSTGRGFRVRRDPTGAVTRSETAGTEADGAPYSGRGSIKTPLLGGELRVNGTLSKSDFKSEDHFRRPGVATDVVELSDNLSGEVGGNYTRPLTEKLSGELVALQKLARSEYYSTFEQGADRSRFSSDAESGESIGRGVLRYKHSDTLAFEGGGEAAFNFRDGQTSFTDNGVVIDIPASNVRVTEKRAEVFGTATWRPRPSLGIEAGSRFEFSEIASTGDVVNERSFVYPKPRLLLTWTPTPNDTVRLRFEREVGQLNFGDFVASANLTEGRAAAGNPDIEPDKTTVIEATVERRFWESGSISVGYTHEEITDAIDRVLIRARPDPDNDPTAPDILFDGPGNIGEGTQDELDVDLTLPLGRFGITGGELKVSAEWVNSEVTDPTTGEGRRISGQRPEEIEVEYRQDLPRFRLTYGGVYLNGFEETYFRYNEIFRVRLDRYFAAFVEYKPDPATSFRVELANAGRFVLDREREVYEGLRNTDPLAFTELFRSKSRQRLALRLRRTFG